MDRIWYGIWKKWMMTGTEMKGHYYDINLTFKKKMKMKNGHLNEMQIWQLTIIKINDKWKKWQMTWNDNKWTF